jgi:hypothetical protein
MFTGDTTRQSVGGYVGGGSGYLTRIDKLTFATEAKSTLSATLTAGVFELAGMADSGVAGYFAGGLDVSARSSRIDKITFPADTKTALTSTLTTGTWYLAGFANSAVAGYFAGGADASSDLSRIDKITFAADTKTTLSASSTSQPAPMTPTRSAISHNTITYMITGYYYDII